MDWCYRVTGTDHVDDVRSVSIVRHDLRSALHSVELMIECGYAVVQIVQFKDEQ